MGTGRGRPVKGGAQRGSGDVREGIQALSARRWTNDGFMGPTCTLIVFQTRSLIVGLGRRSGAVANNTRVARLHLTNKQYSVAS